MEDRRSAVVFYYCRDVLGKLQLLWECGYGGYLEHMSYITSTLGKRRGVEVFIRNRQYCVEIFCTEKCSWKGKGHSWGDVPMCRSCYEQNVLRKYGLAKDSLGVF